MSDMMVLLASRLRSHSRFTDMLTLEYIALLTQFVPLHDIGKIDIPDNILLKPEDSGMTGKT